MIQFNKFINGTNLEHVGFSLLFTAVLDIYRARKEGLEHQDLSK